MSRDKSQDQILEKLDLIARLLAISISQQNLLQDKNQGEQIGILSDLGLPGNIVALVVGTTPEIVSVRLSQMKSAGKGKPKKDSAK